MHIILCHENADFDAIAALLGAHKLQPDAIPVLPDKQNRNVATFLALYQSGLPFVPRREIDIGRVEQITLVDTQRLPQIKGLPQRAEVTIVDHHALKEELEPHYTFTGEVIGATTTLLVERMQQAGTQLSAIEATLLALGIYEDTGSLTYGMTTARDIRAAAWLVERNAALDTVRRFLEPPLNEQQQALFETLLTQADSRVIEGYTVVVCAAKVNHYITEIAGVAHRMRETLDPSALFILVEMPGALHLVCRGTDDAINVGEVARYFGGGGHERAAAASLHDISFDDALTQLWQQIRQVIRPAVRVGDLMSYGVQTIEASKRLGEIVGLMRRIGHEGFPVVENGRVVGLLTRRDADRAMEHGLDRIAAREIMTAGNVTLRPEDSVATLEQKMVESGWGQIPVINEKDRLIGIVTRTDLIKHWAQMHPAQPPGEALTLAQIEAVLGRSVAHLVEAIAHHAQAANLNLYMVGGVVRDLLLERPNFDVDFVVEGDASQLASQLRERYGGTVTSFRPFGTAKWKLDEAVRIALDLDMVASPDHIDFATARNEFYEHPTALPTVYRGSIKLDLGRRDFTINTLAVQFSPAAMSGRILDFYGGMKDLRNRLLRVLHNLSFVDDPTRILRAVRFEHRLDFKIEARTAELIQIALPMLRRITGERVRNELTLLLEEPTPERGLLALQERGMLAAIHPLFVVQPGIASQFEKARTTSPPWEMPAPDIAFIYWNIIAVGIPAEQLPALLERLLTPKALADSMLASARLAQDLDGITHPDTHPAQLDARLSGIPELSLFVVWLITDSPLVRERILHYVTEWRQVRPATNGHKLMELGLKPGPCFTVILTRLRAARLNGDIIDDESEQKLLQALIEEGVCNDSAGTGDDPA